MIWWYLHWDICPLQLGNNNAKLEIYCCPTAPNLPTACPLMLCPCPSGESCPGHGMRKVQAIVFKLKCANTWRSFKSCALFICFQSVCNTGVSNLSSHAFFGCKAAASSPSPRWSRWQNSPKRRHRSQQNQKPAQQQELPHRKHGRGEGYRNESILWWVCGIKDCLCASLCQPFACSVWFDFHVT